MSESTSKTSDSVSNENVKRILALLRAGDEKINLNGFRDVILVLGNTGSGKSTLTHYLAGNNDDLISTEVGLDSGEYIISDTNNKISVNNTIISKTTFSELVIDHETKMIFIDNPGFNDSRNEAYDIAAAYFIKKVLENVKNVKIVLVVNYSSVRKGGDRNDFLELLEHVSILIQHIEKYVDGVALIATKVDNIPVIRNNVVSWVSDNSIIQNIGQFLLEVRESTKTLKNLEQIYTSEFKRAKNELFFENTKNLLDALLQKNGAEYTRLGIFRRPDGPGRLSDIKLLQQGKKIIKRMIKDNLKFVPVDIKDIGYAISDKSKNVIYDLVKEIVENITSDMAEINDVLIDNYIELEEQMINDDMYSLREHLNATSKALAQITSIDESAGADELVARMQENLSNSGKRASEPWQNDMKNLGKFLNFLQDVNDKKLDSFAGKWIKELEGSINYVENSRKWYDFLAALHQRLSDYDVQTDTKRFTIPTFEMGSGPVENFVDFVNFFNKISTADFLKVVNFNELLKVNIDGTKIRYFHKVVDSSLKGSVNFIVSDSGRRLQVTGEYIKLSDVIRHSDYKWAKSVQIFAKHTVFIDADLEKEIDVSIIAPRWDIIGSRVISLNGSSGSRHESPKAANGDNGYGSRNGHDGLPGNPGESAGHFFGLGDVFKHAENLAITAIGGTGGNGQQGGDGAAGNDGKTHNIYDHQYYLNCDRDQHCTTEISYSKSGLFNLNVKGKVNFVKYGSPGDRGGDAGHGGAPGIGGNAGTITLIGAGNTTIPVSRKVGKGDDGGYGLHGNCGRGGRGGANQKAWYYFGTWSDSENYVDRWAGSANDGETGSCIYYSSLYNSNFEGRQKPATKEFMYPPSLVISDFRNELITNLDNCVKKRLTLDFYQMLQKKEIIKYDNVDIIFKELETLEKFYNRISPDVSRLIYTLFLDRIVENAKTFVNDSQSRQHKLLEFLSLAVASKLVRLENKSESRLAYNRQTYFDLLKTADVDQIHLYFYARANEEIKSAENFVKIIDSSVFDIAERTTTEIVRLAQQDLNNELGSQLLKFKLFSNLKIVVEFLKFSAALAQADVALVNTLRVTSASPSAQMSMSAVDGGLIEAHLSFIEEIIRNQVESVRNSISKERKSLKSLGMEFDEISDRLHDAEIMLQSRKPIATMSFVYPAYSQIEDVVRSVITINSDLPNEANGLAKGAYNRLVQDFKFIKFDSELYYSLMESEIEIESLISPIDSLLDRADYLDKTIEELFGLMSPIFRTTRESMTGMLYKPEDLKVLRVMVSKTLDDVKLHVYKFIDQFEIDEDLQLIVENIEEAVSQMTAVFNGVLPGNHDRATLNGFHWYLLMEKELGDSAQNYLTKVLHANSLFYEYERMVDAVKKYVSPFDVSNLIYPPLPAISRYPSITQSSIVSNVNVLEAELEALEQNSKNNTISDDFNSGNQNGPFFIWKSENYQESISKLFLGRAIALKASNNNISRQLLKFDDIRLRLQLDDPTLQQSLEEDLKDFNIFMTHSGSSYFSVCDRVQLVNQDATRFVYKVNETITQLDSYRAGTIEPFLSPYTTWIFKLNPVNENITFASLLPYRKANVDIELEGHATYVDVQNKTTCQKIARSDSETHQTSSSTSGDHTNQPKLIRKRRDVDSSKGIFNTNFLKSLNPFNYFIDTKPESEFEPSSNPQLTEWSYEPNQGTTFSPQSFNMNASLTLVDFVIRNVTKVKPYKSVEKSMSADHARVIAVNILDKYENMMTELLDKEQISRADWQQKDPIQLLGQLEEYVMSENYSKIVDILSDSTGMDPSIEELLREEIIQVVDQSLEGVLSQNTNENDTYYTAHAEGAMFDVFNGSNQISNENFNQSLLN